MSAQSPDTPPPAPLRETTGLSPHGYRLRGRVSGGCFAAELHHGRQRLGRDLDNEVAIDDTSISRLHCLLLVHPDGVTLVDQESKNGTFVDGRRIDRAVAGVGAVLRFGHVELTLEQLPAADARLAFEIAPGDQPAPLEARPEETRTLRDGDAHAALRLEFPPGHVVGSSPAMLRLYAQVLTAAGSRLPVLIVGETGVGKESVAQLVHRSSERRDGPLVAINCAAIPKDLLEAELFGIGERVATGVARRPGKFRQADGGTLLLDEIAEMPAELQAKLLRVLQEGRVEPLGGPPHAVDIHLVAATNQDLAKLIREGRFRSDLYYRLAGFILEVPALRDRREDIRPLIEHMIRRQITKVPPEPAARGRSSRDRPAAAWTGC